MTVTNTELANQLKVHLQEMKVELHKTRYPERAERLPSMIRNMEKAIAQLDAQQEPSSP